MKITNSVKIGGITYKVKEVKLMKEIEGLVGEILYHNQIIRLDSSLPYSDFKKTVFLHEIVHGILENCHLKNDEHFVSCFTRGLYDVIKNNPKIFQD